MRMSLHSSAPDQIDSYSGGLPAPRDAIPASQRGLTLVEVMAAMLIMTLFMVGMFELFLTSRRVTENDVMHAAVTSVTYGIIEQIKEFTYASQVPYTTTDPDQATYDAYPGSPAKTPPYIRIRLNQDQVTWLQCVYNPAGTTPAHATPTTTPPPSSTAASLFVPDNVIGPMALSSISGAKSQPLLMHIWIWIDEMPDVTKDVVQVKRVTVVYTYNFYDGVRTRTVVDREVFLRTRYDQ